MSFWDVLAGLFGRKPKPPTPKPPTPPARAVRSVAVIARTAQGAPVVGAHVILDDTPKRFDGTTNADGYVLFDGVSDAQPGSTLDSHVWITHDGYDDYSQHLNLPNGNYNVMTNDGDLPPLTATFPRRYGLVRASGRVFVDDDGPFRPLGATLFWALSGWRTEPDRVMQNLEWLARHGVQYVRILGQVDWPGQEIDPTWPDYESTLSAFLEAAYNRFGLRTEITLVGGGAFDPSLLASKVVSAVRGREHMVLHLEVANEYFQNFPDERQMRAMADILHQLPNLLAPSSPHNGDSVILRTLIPSGPYQMATIHKERTEGDFDWRFVRQNWDFRDLQWPTSNNEPKGPMSSVSHCEDPLRLAMDRAVGILCGVGAYVLHNGNGVTGRVDPVHNRQANVWELPNADAIYDAVAGVDSVITPGVENWGNANDGWGPPLPVHPLPCQAFWPETRDHGANKNYSAISGGAEFMCMPCGVFRFVELKARQQCTVKVYSPLSRQLVMERSLNQGEVLRLDGDDGANTAYIIQGTM
jgi:hypothetical protein